MTYQWQLVTLTAILSVSTPSIESRSPLLSGTVPNSQYYTDTWVVELLVPEAQLRKEADLLAKKHGFANKGQVGNLNGFYAFKMLDNNQIKRSVSKLSALSHITQALNNEENVGFVEQQIARQRFKKETYNYPTEPNFSKQWSLVNSGQVDGVKLRLDLNVEPVWLQGITGKDVVVSIMDDGLDISHLDIAPNYDSKASWDFTEDDNDPTPSQPSKSDEPNSHGTNCAGEIAMVKDNNKCGVGVAYESSIGCLKFPIEDSTDYIEAHSLSYRNDYIQVYSNSWGPSDNGFIVDKPGSLLAMTLKDAVITGRDGKGSIFVWAAGNGGWDYDSCAADGYSSSIYTISVGSADQTGGQAGYDEQCAGKMVVTYSFNSQGFSREDAFTAYNQLYTTTLNGECTDDFTGTSASTPLVAGVITLALQANHNLSWRDVQYLLVYTSSTDKLNDGEWSVNGGGRRVSHKFGFGAIDAEAFVTRARNWSSVPEQLSQTLTSHQVSGHRDAHSGEPLIIRFTVSNESSDIDFLEHVVLTASLSIKDSWKTYTIDDYTEFVTYHTTDEASVEQWLQDPHPRRGDIKISVTSPQGTTSTLLPFRKYDFVNSQKDHPSYAYYQWPFMSVHYWSENPVGDWIMTVTFKSSSGYVSVSDLELKLYGTAGIPEAVASIPQVCNEACARGCYGYGPDHCDVCKEFRVVSILECVSACPNDTFIYKGSYCTEDLITMPVVNSILAVAVGVSMGSILGLILFIVGACILGYTCKRKKAERSQRLRYHRMWTDDNDNSSNPV